MSNEIFKPVEFDGIEKQFHTTNDYFPDVRNMIVLVPGNYIVDGNKMVKHGAGSQRKIKRHSSHLWPSFPRRRESIGVKAISSNLDGVEE